jgi:hypothetical protein
MTTATAKADQRVPFQLTPFQEKPNQDISITGSVGLSLGELSIHYSLHQATQATSSPVLWPSANPTACRRDGIWQSTCMELFISTPMMQRYWEYNFCPSGDWNIYQLSGYRSNLHAEPNCPHPSITHCKQSGADRLAVITQLPPALINQKDLILAITAVVEQRNGQCSYWALHHGGGEADFHRRDGFQLRLQQSQ